MAAAAADARRPRKRRRRAASYDTASSSSGSDTESEGEDGEKMDVDAASSSAASSASSSSSSSSSDSSDSDSSDSSDSDSDDEVAKKPALAPRPAKQMRMSLSPSPPPRAIPSFLPVAAEVEDDRRARFRRVYMEKLVEGFGGELEGMRKADPTLGAERLQLLINSLASGVDVFDDRGGVDEVGVILNDAGGAPVAPAPVEDDDDVSSRGMISDSD